MTLKRRFKKTYFKGMCTYEPTVQVKGSILISDKFHKKQRLGLGSLDNTFVIKSKKSKC